MRAELIEDLDYLVPGWRSGTDSIRSVPGDAVVKFGQFEHTIESMDGALDESEFVRESEVTGVHVAKGLFNSGIECTESVVIGLDGLSLGPEAARLEPAAKEAARREPAAREAARRELAA